MKNCPVALEYDREGNFPRHNKILVDSDLCVSIEESTDLGGRTEMALVENICLEPAAELLLHLQVRDWALFR